MWMVGWENFRDLIYGVVRNFQEMFVCCRHFDKISGSNILNFFIKFHQELYVGCVRHRVREDIGADNKVLALLKVTGRV